MIDDDYATLIIDVLQLYSPLKCELAGPSVLRGIAAKATFGNVRGGRMHDLASTIGILSGVATLIDLSIKVIVTCRKHHSNVDSSRQLSIVREELVS